jgi:hypothetical protein
MPIGMVKFSKYLKYLRTWGEAGTVKLKSRSHTKLDDCGLRVCL